MGADVIKVETTDAGEEPRGWPPFRTHAEGEATGTVFLSANRNKRSLAIDLRSGEGSGASAAAPRVSGQRL